MSLATADIPSDPEALRAFALACQAELKAAELSVQLRTLEVEELETGEAEDIARAAAEDRPEPMRQRAKPKRKPLPDHLPRQEIVHQPEADGACTCPACGAGMAKLGEDVTEVLDYVPGRFQVIRHVRPKYACRAGDV